MPSKHSPNSKLVKKPEEQGSLICAIKGPGPKYLLKALVGYEDHCLSRYRNPAYSFGSRHPITQVCDGPGPKYLIIDSKQEGFSFGLPGKSFDTFCGPGPKYLLPTPKSPAFSIKSRTKYRQKCVGPGPYSIKDPTPGPAFSIGARTGVAKCDGTPGPRPYSIDMVTLKAPAFSLGYRLGGKAVCDSPGPKYYPQSPKPIPQFSFGTKHSECAPPYITECDEQC